MSFHPRVTLAGPRPAAFLCAYAAWGSVMSEAK